MRRCFALTVAFSGLQWLSAGKAKEVCDRGGDVRARASACTWREGRREEAVLDPTAPPSEGAAAAAAANATLSLLPLSALLCLTQEGSTLVHHTSSTTALIYLLPHLLCLLLSSLYSQLDPGPRLEFTITIPDT